MKVIYFLSTLIIILFCSCSTTENDCICTEEFRSYTVTVVDQNDQPVNSLNIEIKSKTSGNYFYIEQSTYLDEGKYVVMDDSHTQSFTVIPQTIIFSANKNSIHIEEEFVFSTDACKCHISKVSGPDTIRVH